MMSELLSEQQGAPSCYGWRRQPAGIEDSCAYLELAAMDISKGVVLQPAGWERG
jgi:hypothetical protein